MQLTKNFKIGASLAITGILLGTLTFSAIDKFNVSSSHISSVISSPFKSAEANLYKQFIDSYLSNYKKQNTNFKSYGESKCFVQENQIDCSIDNILFTFTDSSKKENSLSIDNVTIKNIKDLKNKLELIDLVNANNSVDTTILLKPDFKSSFEVLLNNIKINNQTQSENIIKTIKEQSVEKLYSESDIKLLSDFVNKHLNTINLHLKDKSLSTDNINNQTELTLSTNTLNISSNISVDLTKTFIELIGKKDINNMSSQELHKYSNDKLNELIINSIGFKFSNTDKNFIKELLEIALKVESDSVLNEEELMKQLDLNFAQILTIINNSQLPNNSKEEIRYKLIDISKGNTSDISITLNNISKRNLNQTASLFMQANTIKDIGVLTPYFTLNIK